MVVLLRMWQSQSVGGEGVNWAIHRAYYIDLLKKGWPLKAAYDEAVRYTVEQEALSVTREVTA